MFVMRPWMFLRDGLAGRGIPVIFTVFNGNDEKVARICRFGRTKWRVQFMHDYSYGDVRFNCPDDALASLG
jgi:hypothetical protein